MDQFSGLVGLAPLGVAIRRETDHLAVALAVCLGGAVGSPGAVVLCRPSSKLLRGRRSQHFGEDLPRGSSYRKARCTLSRRSHGTPADAAKVGSFLERPHGMRRGFHERLPFRRCARRCAGCRSKPVPKERRNRPSALDETPSGLDVKPLGRALSLEQDSSERALSTSFAELGRRCSEAS